MELVLGVIFFVSAAIAQDDGWHAAQERHKEHIARMKEQEHPDIRPEYIPHQDPHAHHREGLTIRDAHVLEHILTKEQYQAAVKGIREPAFDNLYWDNHEEGVYVGVVSYKALFSSEHQFESNTGWPAFTETVGRDLLEIEPQDDEGYKHLVTEKSSGAHLGFMFTDGPPPTGERFCINSGSIHFIPTPEHEKNKDGTPHHAWWAHENLEELYDSEGWFFHEDGSPHPPHHDDDAMDILEGHDERYEMDPEQDL